MSLLTAVIGGEAAVIGGEGHGKTFWTAVALLIFLATLLVAATWRVGRRVRAIFAGRP